MELRPLTLADDDPARLLSATAFGYPPGPPRTELPAGRTTWGAFDGPRLVGMATELEQQQWWGGRLVPAAGIAGVAVAAESRGQGVARLVVEAAAQGGRARGAVISALYPTAPALYRSLGWEHVGALTWFDAPTLAFRGLGSGVVRAGTPSEAKALYDARAAESSGALERSLDGFGGQLSLVDGGYAAWERGGGYRDEGWLDVHDLVAATAEARLSLLGLIGSMAMVAPALRLRVSESDPLHWQLPVEVLRQRSRQPWMLRVLDPAAAVAARGWPVGATVELAIHGEPWRFADGTLERGGSGTARFSRGGFAVWWAGGVQCSALRRAGLLSGPADQDAVLDALAAGPRPELFDYF